MFKSVAVVALALVATAPAFAQNGGRILQLESPKAYKALSQDARYAYIAGVLDFEAYSQPQIYASIEGCVHASSPDQLVGIVDKAMAALPTLDGKAMPELVHNAIVKDCGKR
ncbi:hypothetical protein CH75_16700 [Dyella jiangningensis]|nr:hypothetical protein CH75_16700 [Dyella jiangningensis]